MLSNRCQPNSRVRIAGEVARRRGREHALRFHRLAREENLEIAAPCDVDEAVLGEQAAEDE
ncbi:MAG: hypothetical protein Q8N47_21595 [Bryobacterales bacterium]|nr:hypothetical protein [Bryobacterales bacterium]